MLLKTREVEMGKYNSCPRCGGKTFEKMNSYSHCCECLYFEDYWTGPDRDVIDAEKVLRDLEKNEDAVDGGVDILEFPKKAELEPPGAA